MVYMSNFNKMSRHVERVHWLSWVFTSYLHCVAFTVYCLWTYKKQENYFEIRARTTFWNKLCWRFLYLCERFWSISIWFFFFFLNEKIFVDVNITPKVKAKSCDSVENTFPRYWQKEERTADMLRKKTLSFIRMKIFFFCCCYLYCSRTFWLDPSYIVHNDWTNG